MPPFSSTTTDKEVRMDTVNGLSHAQIEKLLQPLEEGPHIQQDKNTKKLRLRHEYIRARLTQIYGFNGWGEQGLQLTKLHESVDKSGETVIAYGAQIRLIIRNEDGSVRTFYDGAGAWGVGAKGVPIWNMHSDAMNGAASVALCRAAMSLGPQFGLALWADDPATAVVGYSLPHLPLSHVYGAGDGEEDPSPGDTTSPEVEHAAS